MLKYSRSFPSDHSRKRPALMSQTTLMNPRLNCDLSFGMKRSRKRLRSLLGLPNGTFLLLLSPRKGPLRVLL